MTSYIKILLVTLDFYPMTGGVANYYLGLVKGLDYNQVVVLTTSVASLKHESIKTLKQEEFNFKICRKKLLARFIWPKWLPMFWHIWRIVKKERIGMIWVGEVLPTGTVVYFLTKFLKIPYIASCHGTDILQAESKPRKHKLARMILQNAKFVTANSEYTGESVRAMGVDKNTIMVVYPGVSQEDKNTVEMPHYDDLNQGKNINEFEHTKTLPVTNGMSIAKIKTKIKNKKILLSIGRLVPRKGFDNVIKALPRVWHQFPDLIYIIVGDGPDRDRLRQLSNQIIKQCNNLMSNVIFLDSIQGEDKWKLHNSCDVFISPGREVDGDVEGFGIVFLEAAVAGKPVIAGQVGGAKEAVINNQTGIIVDGQNIGQIADAIIKLFKDKKLRQKLGRQGKERVERDFSWKKSSEAFKKLLE